jgi:predicted TIM-barrel fold metal-dependent hydrolase
MANWSRRDTLRLGGGALAASALPGCGGSRPDYQDKAPTGLLIDAHCHLFNGTDLPITTFLTRLALRQFDEPVCDLGPQPLRNLTVEDPTFVEELIQLLVRALLGNTLTAREERDLLDRDHTTTETSEKTRVRRQTEREIAAFLGEQRSGPKTLDATRRDSLREALWQEANAAPGPSGLRTLSARDAAANLMRSPKAGGGIIRWVMLFFRSRQSLAQELVRACESWSRPPLMLVPMLVDYSHWLGETTQCDSSFFDQIAVYGALSRRSPIPIHGMIPFDPLRDLFWQHGRHSRFPDTAEFDPLVLAEEALTQHGFLGLKVYPPMGFRATGNPATDASYPKAAVQALQLPKDAVGEGLDRAMIRAFDFCLRHDAPMLAHANNSVAAGKKYGRRADPWFWIHALKNRPALRLCLAHGGGFCWETAAPDMTKDRNSWEWAIGRYVKDHPQSHLYMDISYFSEALRTGVRTSYIAEQLRAWIHDCDREVRHIIFGTDWIMLDKEPGFENYGTIVMEFLTKDCALSSIQLDRVMWQNAMRFLGLDSGKTRDRLLKFYNGKQPVWTSLKLDGLDDSRG